MAKTKVTKIWRALLGIATELIMSVLLMAVALGLCWLIVQVIT